MKTCKDCKNYKDKTHKTRFGNYPSECTKLKIGVNPDSDICLKYDGERDELIIVENIME